MDPEGHDVNSMGGKELGAYGDIDVNGATLCCCRAEDPIFHQATPLRPEEELSHTRCLIAPPAGQEDQPPDAQGSAPDAQGHAPPAPQPVQGGWFGRGFSKGRKRKKRKTV